MPTLVRVDEAVEVPPELPVIALRDLVFFPYMVLPLLIGRPRSVAALEEAREGDGLILLVAQQDAEVEDPTSDDLFRIGTVIRIVQTSHLPDGTSRVVMEGLGRARIRRFLDRDTTPPTPTPGSEEGGEAPLRAEVELHGAPEVQGEEAPSPELEAKARAVHRLFQEYARLNERISDEVTGTLEGARDRVRMAHLLSGHLLVHAREKQELLESSTLEDQLQRLQDLLKQELEILRIEEKLDREISQRMNEDRRQFYLQEQLKAIRQELDEEEGEWDDLEGEVKEADLPSHARERAERELSRLQRLNPVSPEAAVIRTYLEWIVSLPWREAAGESLDVEHASRILDEAHHGLDEVKDRILDHIAVLSLVGELKGPILCLVGPPGVGKTSLGRSIARALGREFVRVSLGGIRDEAEIRGHRRTYVGALPGRILQGMRRSGSRSPVFLLDEVDKVARDFHGDPSAALLEVLDPEQNRTFTDHYLELEFDLSDVLFVATANTLGGIPGALRDRMETIRIPGYLHTEKRAIARRHLWPKQVERHGLEPESVHVEEEALDRIIDRYTREAGVRELERRLSRVARKVARRISQGRLAPGDEVHIDAGSLRDLLGPPPHVPEDREKDDRAGIANGLAWTAAGGEILDVEVAVVPGDGEIRLTGTLGDVMRESAFAAVTYARSRAELLGLDPDFHRSVDLHIHIPEGATPKDGPSAGITIAVALISALTSIPTRADVALTGEITLRGRVLGVGGIKEKAVAALRTGIRTVVIPESNEGELELLPPEVRGAIRFLPVRTMDQVLEAALVSLPGDRSLADAPLLKGSPDPGVQLSQ